MFVCETRGMEVNGVLLGLEAEWVIVNCIGGEGYRVSECGVGFLGGEGLHRVDDMDEGLRVCVWGGESEGRSSF